jgi:transcriptional regulator with XRE-family HTH domain
VPRNTRYHHLTHEQNAVVNSAPVRKEFARLLKVERLRRGYTQLRLAREAAKFTADKRFASHMIGVYERTITLPGDVHLCAIAKALGKEPKDLLWPLLTTINGHGRDAATTLELTDIGDGRASIRIAAEVSWEVARKLADLIMPPKATHVPALKAKS